MARHSPRGRPEGHAIVRRRFRSRRASWTHKTGTALRERDREKPKYQREHIQSEEAAIVDGGTKAIWIKKHAPPTQQELMGKEMPMCTHTQSEERAAMVDGGTKLQMPISRRAQSWPPSEPGGCGNLPAPQSMHAAELDAPVAELYVPERKGEGAGVEGCKQPVV